MVFNREFHVVRNGINFDEFYRPPAEQLDVIGYSGAVEKINPHIQIVKDWKRGYLGPGYCHLKQIPNFICRLQEKSPSNGGLL